MGRSTVVHNQVSGNRRESKDHIPTLSALTLLTTLQLAVAPCAADELEDSFSKLADQIPFVNYGNFLFDRTSRPARSDPRVAAAESVLRAALEEKVAFALMAKLADHANPRVCTLALMNLYASENPEAFRIIASHVRDTAPTFPSCLESSSAMPEREPLPMEPMTVGAVATRMLNMIGYPSTWTRVSGDDPTFETWGAPRLGNPDWIGWQDFRFRRATGGVKLLPAERAEKVEDFKQALAALPAAVRTWTWLGVADDYLMLPAYDTPLATEAEIVEAGRKLGPEALLAFLRDGSRAGMREPKIDDPERGRRFILLHGKQLFREQDAAELAKMGHFVAAADADPKNASALVRQAMEAWHEPYRSWERARAMAALLDLRTEAETDFVVEWFYATPFDAARSSDQSVFLTEFRRRNPAGWEEPMKRIIAHPDFELLTAMDVAHVARLLNERSGRQVIANDLMDQVLESALRNRLREHFGIESGRSVTLSLPTTPPVEALWEYAIEGEPQSLSLSPDGMITAVGRSKGAVLLFETATGKSIGELPAGGGEALVKFRQADGILLVLTDDEVLTEWDVKDRKQVGRTELGDFPIDEAVIAGNGRLIASRAANEKGTSVFDVERGTLRWTYPMRIRAFGAIAISPDGSKLVICDGFSKTLLLFETGDAKPVATLTGHAGVPNRVRISPDGRLILSTGEDTKVIVWDAHTGTRLHEYQNALARYAAIGFGADSKSAVIRLDREHLLLFDVATGAPRQALKSKCDWVANLEFGPGGQQCIGIEVGQGTGIQKPHKSRYRLKCWEMAAIR